MSKLFDSQTKCLKAEREVTQLHGCTACQGNEGFSSWPPDLHGCSERFQEEEDQDWKELGEEDGAQVPCLLLASRSF